MNQDDKDETTEIHDKWALMILEKESDDRLIFYCSNMGQLRDKIKTLTMVDVTVPWMKFHLYKELNKRGLITESIFDKLRFPDNMIEMIDEELKLRGLDNG